MIKLKGLRLVAINGDASRGIPKKHLDLLQKSKAKPKHLKHFKDERPLNLVISFGKINLEKDGMFLGMLSPFHPFPHNNYIVQGITRFDKTRLLTVNNLRKKMTNSERESLGNDLARDIQQSDGPPITDIFRVTYLRYEFDIPLINNIS